MFIYEIWLFELFFLTTTNLICRSTYISKYFRGSFRFRDNESRLNICIALASQSLIVIEVIQVHKKKNRKEI